MNYAANYERLIARARGRELSGYREKHHVVPRCMGGGNEAGNIVELTGEEHYVAHQLLVKMYPASRHLSHAAALMATRCTGNKLYGWIKRRMAHEMRGNKRGLGNKPSPEACEKLRARSIGNKYGLGKIPSLETRAKLSAANLGKVLTAEHRKKLSESHIGKKASLETRAKLSKSLSGRKQSQEHMANVAAAQRGKFVSLETRAKLSIAGMGRKRGPCSEVTRAKMSAARMGRRPSTETRARLSLARRRRICSQETRLKMSVSQKAKHAARVAAASGVLA